jgi:hypothetical protein
MQLGEVLFMVRISMYDSDIAVWKHYHGAADIYRWLYGKHVPIRRLAALPLARILRLCVDSRSSFIIIAR